MASTSAASKLTAKVVSAAMPKSPMIHSTGNLYQVLSSLPKDGVGARITQARWEKKGIQDSYWEITRVRLKAEGNHGKAWGKLVWKGKPVNEHTTRIRQGLKYLWKDIPNSPNPSVSNPATPTASAA
ncbi:hypothetical protein M407DRAFT_246026 [Tulasnella calospora MUT 4182]|uniref:Uncharacterized protein n=1 Tax=Tulasnella calospora MUT 4182 TaxID=1051891 RepID=A0A0C3PXQ9_9AGAM|nr:hypothetical protein M407DRAFT_246026 [Tulasnella calospora MUT 4182]